MVQLFGDRFVCFQSSGWGRRFRYSLCFEWRFFRSFSKVHRLRLGLYVLFCTAGFDLFAFLIEGAFFWIVVVLKSEEGGLTEVTPFGPSAIFYTRDELRFYPVRF